MSYREECIVHKSIQRGIIEQRPNIISGKKPANGEWLLIVFSFNRNKPSIWNEYKTEELARKQMNKMLRYFPTYVVEKSIFEKHYKGK